MPTIRRLFPESLPTYWALLLIIIVVMLNMTTVLPTISSQGRDSGIFAYTGQVIADDGGLPYRDAWDNKPPGVYYIDALAFKLMGANLWALFAIETAFVMVASFLFWLMLRSMFQHEWLALAGALMFVLLVRHGALVRDSNRTEVYAVLPQVMCLALGYQFLRRPGVRWGLLLGLAASMAFLIRQTTVGVALAFIPAILITQHSALNNPRRWHWLASMIAGGLAGLGITAVYFMAHGAFDDLFRSAFVMPSQFHEWVGQAEDQHLPFFISVLTSAYFTQIFLPLLPFFVYLGWGVYRRWENYDRTLATWVLLMFVVDLFTIDLTGRSYEHYYITLMPSLALVMALGLHRLVIHTDATRLRQLAIAYLVLNMVLVVGSTIREYDQQQGTLFGPELKHRMAVYLQENTAPDDKVLVWGATSSINFQSRRDSPTQHHYAYALLVPGMTTEDDIQEFIDDLARERPVIILDRSIGAGNRVPPLGLEDRERWWATGGRTDIMDLQPVFDFVAAHCVPDSDQIEPGRSRIYRCTYPEAATQ